MKSAPHPRPPTPTASELFGLIEATSNDSAVCVVWACPSNCAADVAIKIAVKRMLSFRPMSHLEHAQSRERTTNEIPRDRLLRHHSMKIGGGSSYAAVAAEGVRAHANTGRVVSTARTSACELTCLPSIILELFSMFVAGGGASCGNDEFVARGSQQRDTNC